MERKWWKESVVYQIYPRSFCDGSGDGIGDLAGILSKLDYLRELGVNVLWLSPVYDSPNADNGYDIRDYKKIMAEFGTMEDFDRLLAATHQKGLKIVMDLVVNHTSDEHEWFRKSRQDPKGQYRDYYIWRNGKDGAEPNNWAAAFGGPAWKYDNAAGQYYFHLFAEKQPDLNWENETVRNEVYAMMKWWLDKGIDGFRMDAINAISKDPAFPDGPITPGQQYAQPWKLALNGPRVHEFLYEMNREVLSHYDVMTVGETSEVAPEEALQYVGNDRDELNMLFQFEHVNLGGNENGKWNDLPVDHARFKEILTRWQTALDGKGWNGLYLSNHDQPRQVSRFGNDGSYRPESAKMLATLLYTMQGTPFLYQGEEIGMTNAAFDSIDCYRDIETLNNYRELGERLPGGQSEILHYIHLKSRDNARTPMQWSAAPGAGFTAGTPWIPLNPNYREINVERSLNDPGSILSYYKKLIALRKSLPCLVYGSFRSIEAKSPNLFCYLRELEGEKLLVLLNLDENRETLPAEVTGLLPDSLLIANYADAKDSIPEALRPYEALVFHLK